MLGWLSSRSLAVVDSKATLKVAKTNLNSRPVSSRTSFAKPFLTRQIRSPVLVTSISCRSYAKVVRRSPKTGLGNASTKKAPVHYDEDFEDDDTFEDNGLDIEDVTHLEKNDASYLNSSQQIEEILRNSMPPDMVAQAIAEHRRVYSAYKQGKLSQADASRAGFVQRIDSKSILSNLEAAAHGNAARSSTSSSTASATRSSPSRAASATQTATQQTSQNGPKYRLSGNDDEREFLEKYSRKVEEEDDADEFDPDDPEGEISEKSVRSAFSDLPISGELEGGGEEARMQHFMAKAKKVKRYVAPKPDLGIVIDPEDFLHKRAQKLQEINGMINKTEEPSDQDADSEMYSQVKKSLDKIKSSSKSSSSSLKSSKTSKSSKSAKSSTKSGKTAKSSKSSSSKSSLLDEYEENSSSILARARTCIAKGKWDEALELHKRLATRESESSVLSTFANNAYNALQYNVAGQAAIAAFNMNPDDVRANVVAARVLVAEHVYSPDKISRADAKKRLAMAMQHADRALEKQKEWPDMLALKGSVYMCMKDYKTACAYFKAALIQLEQPEFALLRVVRTHIHRDYGKSLAGRGLYKQALNQFKYGLQLEPENLELMALLGELFERGFNDLEGAAKFYEMAIQTRPDDVPSLVRYAQTLADPMYSGHNIQTARLCYQRAMTLQPNPEFWFPLGWLSMHLGENDRALTCLQRAAELDENSNNRWTSLVLMAEIYAFDTTIGPEKESLDRAIQLYELALQHKDTPDVRMNLAKCLLKADRLAEAQTLLEAIKHTNPENCELRCALTEAYYVAGNLDEAMRELEETIAYFPNETMPQYLKGKYLSEAGHHVAAIEYLERSVAPALKAKQEAMEEQYEEDNDLQQSPELEATLKDLEAKVNQIKPGMLEELKAQAMSQMQSTKESASNLSPNSILQPHAPEIPPYTAEAFQLLAKGYSEAEMWLDAKKSIGYAMKYTSDEAPELLSQLAECQIALGEEEEAMTSLRKASVLNPESAETHYQLGELFFQQDSPVQAMSYFEKALAAMERAETRKMEAKSQSTQRSQAPTSHKSNDEIDPELAHAIYSSMSKCCTQLATLDRANSAKLTKQAKQWMQMAEKIAASYE